MLNRPLKDRRFQPIVRSMRRQRTHEYVPSGRLVRFEREGDRLVRYLTCLICEDWYRAEPNAPVHCGKGTCADAALHRKRKSMVAWT